MDNLYLIKKKHEVLNSFSSDKIEVELVKSEGGDFGIYSSKIGSTTWGFTELGGKITYDNIVKSFRGESLR